MFPGGKGGRFVRLTTLLPSCAVVMISGNLNFLEPSGHSRPVTGLLYFYLYVFYMPYDCEFKKHNYSHFPKLKITTVLKFEVLFFTVRESQKYSSRRTSGLAERVVNLTESGMYKGWIKSSGNSSIVLKLLYYLR